MRTLLLTLFIFSMYLHSQERNPAPYTKAEDRLRGFKKRVELQEKSLFKQVKFKSVGPTVQSGRVVDVDVSPEDPTVFYVAYASGGLWKTTNNGISFYPIFDFEASMTIGDIAMDWDNGIIYVGTGENNSSRSSYAGTGIYRSTNDGKNWEHLGLAETHRIGRIVIDPTNSKRIWVAALGHLYSSNAERGIYKSLDGGKNWVKTLFVDENTGTIDLVINPYNSNILYSAMWFRTRRAWNFTESGSTSGIYKSIDGGDTWDLLTLEGSGFPTGEGVGRIGLSVSFQNPDIIYALLDNQFRKEEEKEYFVTKELLKAIEKEEFLTLEEDSVNGFLDRHDFPLEYDAKLIFDMVRNGKIKPVSLVEYLEDANRQLFDQPVIGAEVYKSSNGGKNWIRTNDEYLDRVYNSYGYYFGEIRVSPSDDEKIYVLGVPILFSPDGGKTFHSINESNVHADHQAMWINPEKDGHLIIGNDGGINISYDNGKSWFKANAPPVGQFYTVNYDTEKPYNVYGGLQDNGVWYGPSTHEMNFSWYSSGHYPFKLILGGDGMQVAIDKRENNLVYTGYQFGNYFRIDKSTGKSTKITPRHELGERPYRFNWQTPIHLSVHNEDILYMGSHMLHRSLDRGETWSKLSGDLTDGGKRGDVPYGTLTTIHESPLKFGLIYTGSDDGLIHVTLDGGNSWNRISDNLPQKFWISRVCASNHLDGLVYVSLNGYRWDNFESLIYRSDDYGKTWERIGLNLPSEPVNVIKEDPTKANILYVGTDHSVYISTDAGKTFMGLGKEFPAVAVHDLVVHPDENDLILGTHGRSIYIADVFYIQNLTEEIVNRDLHLFSIDSVKYSKLWGGRNFSWKFYEPPKLNVVFYSKLSGESVIRVVTESNLVLKEMEYKSVKGLNFIEYDLTLDHKNKSDYEKFLSKKNNNEVVIETAENNNIYLRPGNYNIQVEISGAAQSADFKVIEPKKKKRGKTQK
ncbi:WD40/YVTN/BNR-like repeat-containing protein [Bacteroidota bacterium]